MRCCARGWSVWRWMCRAPRELGRCGVWLVRGRRRRRPASAPHAIKEPDVGIPRTPTFNGLCSATVPTSRWTHSPFTPPSATVDLRAYIQDATKVSQSWHTLSPYLLQFIFVTLNWCKDSNINSSLYQAKQINLLIIK